MSEENGTPANTLTLAEAKEAELKGRLERAREDAAANRKKAHDLAFQAEAADDVDAKRTATKLLEDARKLEDDIKHRLTPAVEEAERRVKAAREAVAIEAQRRKAEEARTLAERLEALGAGRDAAFEQAKASGAEFNRIMDKLRLLGAPTPSRDLVDANTTRALDTALAGLHPEARVVPPLQRHRFASLYHGWANMTLGWASKILDADASHGRAA